VFTVDFNIFSFLLESEKAVSREKVLQILQKIQEIEGILSIQSFNHTKIISSRQIKSAVWHAIQGFLSNKMISNQLSVDVLLYLSCQRQISKAIEKLGISRKVKKFGLIVISGNITKNAQSYLSMLKFRFDEYLPNIKLIEINPENSNVNQIEKRILSKIALLRMNNY
jgi:tRNA threonylcarbamoyladenosine modification (KEOPS) complex Cgi121 subunit